MGSTGTARRGWFIEVSNFAQIAQSKLSLGDLTLLVGPQATGKSLVLQLLKLAIDRRQIVDTLQQNAFFWHGVRGFLDVYLGEGLGEGWRSRSSVRTHAGPLKLPVRAPTRSSASLIQPRVFYLPAQRSVVMAEGWPRPFTQFMPDTPFVVREFSEDLRLLADSTATAPHGAPPWLSSVFSDAIFHGGTLRMEVSGARRRFVIEYATGSVPFMAWSAGQREFVPLLLGLMHLLPGGDLRPGVEAVIIEEPEMGLHPEGILAVMLLVLELLRHGYRVVISTHSPVLVDVVWALGRLKEHHAPWTAVADLFALQGRQRKAIRPLASRALQLDTRAYYMGYREDRVRSLDMSSLDPGSDRPEVAGWGGLTGLSGRIGDVVAHAVNSSR